MIRLIAIALIAFLPIQASALSCLPFHVQSAWQKADESTAIYSVVLGEFEFDANELPRIDLNDQAATPPDTRIKSRFTGKILATNGFTVPFEQEVELSVRCQGPWCAGMEPRRPALAFLEHTDNGLLLTATPCINMAFFEPTDGQIESVLTCADGGPCAAPSH